MNEVKWLVLVVIILLCLMLLILFTKLTIYINYYHHKDDDNLRVELRAWFGLIRYKKSFPIIKVDDQSAGIIIKEKAKKSNHKTTATDKESKITVTEVLNSLKNYREILQHVFELNRITRRFFKKVAVRQFEWHSVIGVGDAAHTGTVSGVLWAIKGSIISLLSHYLRMKTMPKLLVQPNFQQVITQTNLSCMIQFRVGHAIVAGLKIVKFWKGGKPLLKANTIISNDKVKSI